MLTTPAGTSSNLQVGVLHTAKFRIMGIMLLLLTFVGIFIFDRKDSSSPNIAPTNLSSNLVLPVLPQETLSQSIVMSSPTVVETPVEVPPQPTLTPTSLVKPPTSPVQETSPVPNVAETAKQPTTNDTTVREYTIQQSDTLGAISKREYGKESFWKDLRDYNVKHGINLNCQNLKLGTKILLPPKKVLSPATSPNFITPVSVSLKENKKVEPPQEKKIKTESKHKTDPITIARQSELPKTPNVTTKSKNKSTFVAPTNISGKIAFEKNKNGRLCYVVQAGDSLEEIFRKICPKEDKIRSEFYKKIVEAYPTIKQNPSDLDVGMLFPLPNTIVETWNRQSLARPR